MAHSFIERIFDFHSFPTTVMTPFFHFLLRQALPGLGRRGLLLLSLAGTAPAAFAQSSFGPALTYPTNGTSSLGVALGDVNGDGRRDIVTANQGTDNVSVLLGQASPAGTFGPAFLYATGAGSRPTGVALGDVNGDGRLDIVTGNQASNAVAVLLNSAAAPGTFAALVQYPSGGQAPNIVALADLNGDGRLDIAAANTGGSTVGVLLASATTPGTFGTAAVYPSGGSSPVGITIGDVNGDGRPDIVTGSNSSSGVVGVGVLLASATTPGTFGSAVSYPSGGGGTVGVALADVNRDGRVDIVATNGGSSTVAVLLGSATAPGTFAAPVTYPSGGTGPNFTVLGDVNGDGLADIVTANSTTGTVAVLAGLAAPAGTFAPATTYPSGGPGPIGIALADVNGDGRRDIVTAHYMGGSVGVLLNTGTFLAATASFAAADLSLYPNPAHDAFTLLVPAAPGAGQVELLNALGQVVRRQEVAPARAETRLAVETAGLPAGVYTVRLRAGATIGSRRLVLQ